MIWIAGDLNLPCIDWNFNTNGSSLSNIFLDFILEFGFTQLVDFPTRGQNTLDVFLTNYPSYEYTCQPRPLTGISDHEIICLTSVVDVDYHQATIKKVYLWHSANFNDIRPMANNLSGEFLNNYDTDTPIEELWSEFNHICRKCLNQVPTKLSNKHPQQPWINARIS